MRKHVVQSGECLSSIAFANGFFWQSLWELPENAELRATRGSPFVLRPGDVLHIPELRQKTVVVDSNARHRFRRRGVPARLRLTLRIMDQPLANLPYTLEFGEELRQGTTDDQGTVDTHIPPDIERAILRVGEGEGALVYELLPRKLNPLDGIDGVQSRLTNLGYYRGPIDGKLDESTKAAIRQFQSDQGLVVSGELDAATLESLLRGHAC